MFRLTMILLCLILAAAAAGRYQAEVAVRGMKEELVRIERAKAQELTEIRLLRAEIAYLESPERLAAIAASVTDLEPISGAQLMSADDFLFAFRTTPAARTAEPGRDRGGPVEVAGLGALTN